jgi:hypothetical protein
MIRIGFLSSCQGLIMASISDRFSPALLSRNGLPDGNDDKI